MPPKNYNQWPMTKRAGRACLSCRARKVKCDVEEHGQPCSNCLTDEAICQVQKSKRGRYEFSVCSVPAAIDTDGQKTCA